MITVDEPTINLFFYEMSVNFHMLCSIMMNWVLCNADGSFVVTQHSHSVVCRNSEFFKHPFQPNPFTNTMCHSSKFSFSAASCYHRLLLAPPRDQVAPHK